METSHESRELLPASQDQAESANRLSSMDETGRTLDLLDLAPAVLLSAEYRCAECLLRTMACVSPLKSYKVYEWFPKKDSLPAIGKRGRKIFNLKEKSDIFPDRLCKWPSSRGY